MSGFRFSFDVGGKDAAGTQAEATECQASAAAPAIEVAMPAAVAEPFGPLQDVALTSDVCIRLRVRAEWSYARLLSCCISFETGTDAGSDVQSLNSHSATKTFDHPDLAASDLLPGQYEGVPPANAFVASLLHAGSCLRCRYFGR
jgi:hypothetical protein